jgi:serine/threonine protein kinase
LHQKEEQRDIENFARYLFRQFIAGLKEIHNSGCAHLDIKIQNVFVDLQEHIDGMWVPCIQIAGLGKTTKDYLKVSH